MFLTGHPKRQILVDFFPKEIGNSDGTGKLVGLICGAFATICGRKVE